MTVIGELHGENKSELRLSTSTGDGDWKRRRKQEWKFYACLWLIVLLIGVRTYFNAVENMIFRARNLALLLLIAAFVFAEESSKPVEKDDKLEKKASDPLSISTLAPNTSTPTEDPMKRKTTTKPTTTPIPTTTTPVPTTTPTPTTPTPTTTTPTPTTSTSTSTTPTTPTPTPTVKPTTPPHPADSWIVTGPNGTVCITANMVMKVGVTYNSIENKTIDTTFKVDNVQNATAGGMCTGSNNTESLVLTWSNVTATFNFSLNVTHQTYSLNSIEFVVLVNNFTFPNNKMTNVSKINLAHKGELFSVSRNNSYTCAEVPHLDLTVATMPPSTNSTVVSAGLTVTGVHVQAFGMDTSSKYRAPMDCASHQTPDIVPIAVGLVLAGLVVIVLVAYLVGRKRAQSRGYLSM